ncbi:uncharacterized protein [Dermacentor andersoni]|uniref:uncharacterized protein n=1 Tax=Dermacentor andersoni TaxID=34620 RepID=UPI002418027F|nr:uncharacterized protein LOC129380127 [Dermacentor andersoni]
MPDITFILLDSHFCMFSCVRGSKPASVVTNKDATSTYVVASAPSPALDAPFCIHCTGHRATFFVSAFLQTSVFVLYQRSFERDLLLGGDGQCFHGRNYEWNHEEKYSLAETYYWDNTTARIIKKPVYLYPEATPGYEVPNAMTVSPYKGKLVSIYYPFVVSEYDNCDILRSPRHDNGCELWVTRQGVQNVSSACLFIYDLLCGPNKFQKYDEEFCRDKIQIR